MSVATAPKRRSDDPARESEPSGVDVPTARRDRAMNERQSLAYGHIAPSAARDALVALRNTEHLARSPKVGQKVVTDLLPELLTGLESLDSFFRVYDKACPDSAVCSLAFSSLEATRSAIVASSGPGASARLGLERALGREVPNLEGCVEVCELWSRAALRQTTELSVRDIVASVFAPSEKPSAYIVAVPAEELPFVADPIVAVWLLRGMLSAVAEGSAFVALPGQLGPEITLHPTAPVGARMSLRAPHPRVVLGAVSTIAAQAGLQFERAPLPKLVLPTPPPSHRPSVSVG